MCEEGRNGSMCEEVREGVIIARQLARGRCSGSVGRGMTDKRMSVE